MLQQPGLRGSGLVREQARIEGDTRSYTPHVGEPMRDAEAYANGRFGWSLAVNGRDQAILMPGVELAHLRGTHLSTPCLIVNGSAWWWNDAASMAVPIPAARRSHEVAHELLDD